MAGFIPRKDAEFDAWVTQFLAALTATPANYGLIAGDLTAANAALATWATAFGALPALEAALAAGVEAKDGARVELEALCRGLARQAQAAPATTDAARATAGLPVYDNTPTPSPTPTTLPVLTIELLPLRHVIHFRDESTPTSKQKPAGARGCQLWAKIGDPAPTTTSQLTFVALDTATPYSLDFDGADAGKTVYYRARWQGAGENSFGPWGAVVSATVPG